MFIKPGKVLFLLILILSNLVTINSIESIRLQDINPNQKVKMDGNFVGIYLDENDDFTIENSYSFYNKFSPLNQNTFGLLDQRHNIWLRLTVERQATDGNEWILYGWLDTFNITLYSPINGNGLDQNTTWETKKLGRTALIKSSSENSKTYYLKIGDRPGWFTGIYLSNIDSYISSFRAEYIIYGIFYGIIIAIIIYNLMFYFAVKDRVFLWYVGYLAGMLCFFFRQNGFLYLIFPNFTTNQLYSFGFVSMVVGAIFAIGFSVSFLGVQRKSLKRVALGLQMFWVIIAITYFLVPHHLTSRIDAVGGILTVIVLLYFVYVRLKDKYTFAIFYAISWGILGVSEVINILTVYRFFPINKLTTSFFQIGSALELLFLSLALGFRVKLLQDSMNTYKKGEEYLKKINSLDPLTGLLNRRSFKKVIDAINHSFVTTGRKYSIIFIDIDNFKAINDVYGHPFGDIVIKEVAGVIKRCIRQSDQPFRYGGEEFLITLPETSAYIAKQLGERVRKGIEDLELTTEDNKLVGVTVSIGVAQASQGLTGDDVVLKADKALYSAKNSGKNRVIISIK